MPPPSTTAAIPAKPGARDTARTPAEPPQLTSAAIDARDFLRARENEKTQAHLPEGTLVAVTGSKPVENAQTICTALDHVHGKYPDMVLVHGGGPGAEKIAARWAESKGVHQVVCRPDWNAHGRAAPFRRNDQLLKLLPKGLISFPGQRRLRQPGRQGHPARHSRPQNRALTVAPFAGRVPPRDSARAFFFLNSLPPRRTPRPRHAIRINS